MSVKELTLNLEDYIGGVAIWPAYPAIFSTVKFEDDPNLKPGIHVHARHSKGGRKVIDDTFDLVKIESIEQDKSISLDYSSAKTFLIANLLGKKISSIKCDSCKSTIENNISQVVGENEGECIQCGYSFNISNDIYSTELKEVFKSLTSLNDYPDLKMKTRTLNLNLDKYPGGISLMTCCRAIIWTGEAIEEDGIHGHGYDNERIRFDSTVGKVVINGLEILSEHMKMLSVQRFLELRVETTYCDVCGNPHFDKNENALKPSSKKQCTLCRSSTTTHLVISNPMIDILSKLNEKCSLPSENNIITQTL